jgi:hypothetical protein
VLIPAIVALVAGIESWAQFDQTALRLVARSNTLAQLQGPRIWWQSLSTVQRTVPGNKDQGAPRAGGGGRDPRGAGRSASGPPASRAAAAASISPSRAKGMISPSEGEPLAFVDRCIGAVGALAGWCFWSARAGVERATHREMKEAAADNITLCKAVYSCVYLCTAVYSMLCTGF